MSLPKLPRGNRLCRRESPGYTGSKTAQWVLRSVLVMLLCWASRPVCLFAADDRWQWQAPVTHEIRYHLLKADEVLLVWWLSSGEAVPENLYPPGTKTAGNVLFTPMARVDGAFVAQVRALPGITVDHVFYIAGTRHGTKVEFWDTDGYPRNYHTTVMPGQVTDVYAKVALLQAQEFMSPPDTPIVRQEIRYYDPVADEVVLEWKYDGQSMVPETRRPPGTMVKDTVMCTPMTRTNGVFVTTVRVPLGSVILYGFRITKNQPDVPTQVWKTDGYRNYSLIALQDRVVEVKAKQPPAQMIAAPPQDPEPGLALLGGLSATVSIGAILHRRRRRRRFRYDEML